MVEGAKNLGGKAAETAVQAKDAVVSGASAAGSYVAEGAAEAKDLGQNFLNKVTFGAYKGGSNANRAILEEQMTAAGITNPVERAHFMAQVDHESGGFKRMTENLNYSASGLRKTFGKYYKTDAEANADARNPEAIANKVYGRRMGNIDPGDGWKYRGRGHIQLTGRDNYAKAGQALGIDLLKNPDLVANDPEVAAKVAIWYWNSRGIGKKARAGDTVGVRKAVNGGTNGLSDTQRLTQQYLAEYSSQAADSNAPDVDSTRSAQSAQTQSPSTTPATPNPTTPPATYSATPATPSAMPSSAATATRTSAAPSPEQMTPPSAPSMPTPLASNGRSNGAPTEVVVAQPLTQNLSDRGIAHLATGGIGSTRGGLWPV